MERFFWICFAGALGTGTRYLVALYAGKTFGTFLPYGTFIVNVTGCFLIAAIMQAGTTLLVPPTLRLALTTGFMGGLTTYSSFNYETLRFCQEGAWGRALANVVVTLVLCALAGVLGLALARRIAGS